jgi:hypothetical protein
VNTRLRQFAKQLAYVSRGLGYVAYFYFATYAILMHPGFPVFHPESGRLTIYACYLFGPSEQSGELTIILPTACWVNKVFYPIDLVRSVVSPKQFDPTVSADRGESNSE